MLKKLLLKFKSGAITAPICGSLTFALLAPFARLDPDLHHDGLMSTAAIAVRGFSVPHREFFAQYGPISPLLQAIPLFFGIPAVLGIRLLNVMFIAGTVWLLTDLPRLVPQSWGIRRSSAVIACAIWVVLSDVFLGVPMLAWTSVIASFQVALVIWLLFRGLELSEDLSRVRAPLIVFAGVVSSSVIFTRITVGITLCFFAGVTALVLWVKSQGTIPKLVARNFLFGLVSGSVGQLSLLVTFGASQDWYRQSIQWPAQWRHIAVANYRPFDVLLGSAGNVFPEVAALLLLAMFLSSTHRSGALNLPEPELLRRQDAVFLLFGIWVVLRIFGSSPRTPSLIFAAVNLGPAATDGRKNLSLLFAIVVGGVLASVIALLNALAGSQQGSDFSEHWGRVVISIGAIATVSQVWPVPDSRHVWWGAPLPIFSLVLFVRSFAGKFRTSHLALLAPVLVAAVFSVSNGWKYLELPRSETSRKSELDGMLIGYSWAGPQDVGSIDRTIALLKEVTRFGRRCVFLVEDGFWAGFDGEFRSLDEFYVNWGNVAPLEDRIVNARCVVVSRSLQSNYETLLIDEGFKLNSPTNSQLVAFERAKSISNP